MTPYHVSFVLFPSIHPSALFQNATEKFGKEWKKIASIIKTKTDGQVRTHYYTLQRKNPPKPKPQEETETETDNEEKQQKYEEKQLKKMKVKQIRTICENYGINIQKEDGKKKKKKTMIADILESQN